MSDSNTLDGGDGGGGVGGGGPPPTQPLAPGNYDKAWNDPPLFSYSAASGQTGPGTNRLNKRVAFPTQQAAFPRSGLDPTAPPKLYDAGMKPPSSPQVMPPPPPAVVPSPPQHSEGGLAEETPTTIDPLAVEQTFQRVVEKYLEQEVQADMKSRLAVLFRDWREGRLNSAIQAALRDLAGCLEGGEVGGSEASFTVLSADWSSVIGPNIIVIKKITYAVKLALSTEKTEEAVTKPL